MNKDQFLAAVAADVKLPGGASVSAVVVKEVLVSVASLAAREVVASGRFRVPGLVNLTAKRHAARTAKNPKTGTPCEVAAGITVKAKPVASFADEVRGIDQAQA